MIFQISSLGIWGKLFSLKKILMLLKNVFFCKSLKWFFVTESTSSLNWASDGYRTSRIYLSLSTASKKRWQKARTGLTFTKRNATYGKRLSRHAIPLIGYVSMETKAQKCCMTPLKLVTSLHISSWNRFPDPYQFLLFFIAGTELLF